METEDKNIPKPKQAVAVRYREDKDTAPRIVAKGTGFTAEQIINTAVQHSVPLYQNSTMAGMLMAVELDREIPPELYKVVAEVLAYIFRIDQRLGQQTYRR
ncbi:flagellar biosynthesis protein [Anaerospora hongkongensis]|uniref:Flagellar biosynthesis protein n=1 Tax=Anaerospora hongkongensis TaxID=244830 RepID=A0A4R1Q6I8_9FIRM|nr:EscU/YscU/HrcU family type III secretion system export apparatus switch protein [Anaerospora hongkongensis]TCL40206.1 flagellar biosynthesis protein [Anaerospora hongkongensis]